MIVIPMRGESSRFRQAGYHVNKYMLPLSGSTVFTQSILTFSTYFTTDQFIFICQSDTETIKFIEESLKVLKVENYKIVPLDNPTRGQADTVFIGTSQVDPSEEMFIFNIDTIQFGFSKTPWHRECDGYLEVFNGEGDHWSFVRPGVIDNVIETTEKVRISNLCSNGLYYFRKKEDFDCAFTDAVQNSDITNGEFYIAPLYNFLIKNNKNIRFHPVNLSDHVFCGTPKEYEDAITERR